MSAASDAGGAGAWAARVYEIDKRAAGICTLMSVNGFAFDRAAGAELAERLKVAEAAARLAAHEAVGREIASGKSGGFSNKDLARAFFQDLRAPVYFRSDATNAPSIGVDALRAYAACADPRLRALALAVLEWRRARKIRVTYIENVELGDDLRVHPTWLNYGAVSGRFACQGPNLMNLPTQRTDPTIVWGRDAKGRKVIESGGIRSLYVARPGYVLVGFDAKQLEMRIAAYASQDATMIQACESSDLHAGNAAVIFGDAFLNGDDATRYALRNLAKQSGFAVCYMAEAATVHARIAAAGESVTLRQVEAMLAKLRRAFRGYFQWQDRRLLDVVRTGWVSEPVTGRRRWLGHDPSPTEAANFPIQGGAAGLMNSKLPAIVARLAQELPRVKIVAQVHDAGVFEAPEAQAGHVVRVCNEAFAMPIVLDTPAGPCEAVFPIDIGVEAKWH